MLNHLRLDSKVRDSWKMQRDALEMEVGPKIVPFAWEDQGSSGLLVSPLSRPRLMADCEVERCSSDELMMCDNSSVFLSRGYASN